MILEKVYDELYGMIEDLKKKIGKGGSVVTITPTLESGDKIADYSIGSDEGSLYIPNKDYSATAKEICKWTDGRAVKRIVYEIDNPFSSATTITNALPEDFGFLVNRYGAFVRNMGSSGIQYKEIEYRTEEPTINQYGVACYIGNDDPADPLLLTSTLLGYTAAQIEKLIIVIDYAVSTNTRTKTTKKK